MGNAGTNDASAYDKAAALYRQENWDDAVVLFDKIAATNSPYRAASAYSAARSAFYLGQFDDGFSRVGRLLSDPAMHEFHRAAYHLIGTLANQSGSAQLVAARFAEISHYLIAPLEVFCREQQLQQLAAEAEDDLFHILQSVYPADRFTYFRDWSQHTRQILDTLAGDNRFLDLVRVLASPSPYRRQFGQAYGWIESFPPAYDDLRSYADNEAARQQATADAAALTEHARQQWLGTKSLLWGYALAVRTSSPDDIRSLQDMVAAADSFPRTPEVLGPIVALHYQFVAQQARLLLTAGRMDEAIAAVRDGERHEQELERDDNALLTHDVTAARNSIETYLVDGGVRYLLERCDLDAAREWASKLQSIFHSRYALISIDLAHILAQSWDEFVEIDVKHTQRPSGPGAAAAAALDLLPAQMLVTLSQHAGLSAPYKRALLSEAWVRLYMLGRWSEFLALLPKMREAFPEIASDIDQINAAWTDRTRHHLATRLLLRTPGLSPRVLWTRPSAIYAHRQDLFSIDGANVNDANWWCPLDVGRANADLLGHFFVTPIEPNKAGAFDVAALKGLSPREFGYSARQGLPRLTANEELSRLAGDVDKLIAWQPLFKNVDRNELVQLAKVASGPRQLSEEAVAWADSSNWFTRLAGSDEFLPETLHLAVRSTRYGCRLAGRHGSYSRAAFAALHRLYPESEWAKKTPYWFDELRVVRAD